MKTIMLSDKKHVEPSFNIIDTYFYHDRNVIAVEVLVQTSHGIFEAKGSAMRDKNDEFSLEIGETLAVSRALDSLASGLARRAKGLINHADHTKQYKLKQAAKTKALKDSVEAKPKRPVHKVSSTGRKIRVN